MASLNTRKKLTRETIQKAISEVEKLPACKARAVAITNLETASMWILGGDFDGVPRLADAHVPPEPIERHPENAGEIDARPDPEAEEAADD